MSHLSARESASLAITNQPEQMSRICDAPFALVRDHARGRDEWHPLICVERLGLGDRLEIVLTCHDFWFVRDDDAHWYGPFHTREAAASLIHVGLITGPSSRSGERSGRAA